MLSGLSRAGISGADFHHVLYFRCNENWSGQNCSNFVCDGAESVCENGGTCLADPSSTSNFFCVCPPGVLGNRCQYRPYVGKCALHMMYVYTYYALL